MNGNKLNKKGYKNRCIDCGIEIYGKIFCRTCLSNAYANSWLFGHPFKKNQKAMNGKSKKVSTTERWVDRYTEKNGYPPTVTELAHHFKISRTAAYMRCNKFRDKLKQQDIIKKSQNQYTRVKLEYLVPNDVMDLFTGMLDQINKILK